MKNKNRIFRAAALLLVLCFISTVMISGTFAKYTSEYSGEDTALVARWNFEGFAGQNPVESTTELDLFKHEFDKHINQKDGNDYIIAPGVSGEFVVAMDYLADVDADVVIGIKGLEDNALVPVEYSVDGGSNWVELDGLADALANEMGSENASENIFRIAAVGVDSTTAVNISETVKWQWPYDAGDSVYEDSSDETDTILGEESYDEGVDGNNNPVLS